MAEENGDQMADQLLAAAQEYDTAVEAGPDVAVPGVQIKARPLVGKRAVVPGIRPLGADEISFHDNGAGAAQNTAAGIAAQRVEAGQDANRHRAGQQSSPDIGSLLEQVQALLADGRARISAHRNGGRRVIETLTSGIGIDDHDSGGLDRAQRQGDQQQKKKQVLHDYFTSASVCV